MSFHNRISPCFSISDCMLRSLLSVFLSFHSPYFSRALAGTLACFWLVRPRDWVMKCCGIFSTSSNVSSSGPYLYHLTKYRAVPSMTPISYHAVYRFFWQWLFHFTNPYWRIFLFFVLHRSRVFLRWSWRLRRYRLNFHLNADASRSSVFCLSARRGWLKVAFKNLIVEEFISLPSFSFGVGLLTDLWLSP